jgi:hypothetical protein
MSYFKCTHKEDGFAVVTAILILFIILMLGLAAMQTGDVQTHQTGHEVAGEAAFNLAESALNAEADQLDSSWPTSSNPWIQTCNQSSAATTGCPGTTVTNSFTTQYAGVGYRNSQWSVQVVDDSGASPNYYSDALLPGYAYDSNGDGRLWVRAQATIWGQKRIVVAQVVRTQQVMALPQSVITSGGVYTSNNGNKVIIEAKDPNSGLTGTVDVRCSASAPDWGNDSTCAGWDPKQGQLDPASAWQAGNPTGSFSTLSGDSLNALRQTAWENGTYYPTGCPPEGTVGIVFVEDAICKYTTAATWGSDSTPVALIVNRGTVEINGKVQFYGIIYAADAQGTPSSGCTTQNGPVVTVHGGGALHGAIFVDNCGTVDAGDDKFDVVYDTAVFGGFYSYSTPVLAKNTFRIMPNG